MARRFLLFVLVIAMATSLFAVNAARPGQEPPARQKPSGGRFTVAQKQALAAFGADVEMELDDQDIPSFLMGRLSQRTDDDPATAAKAALDLYGAAFRRTEDDDFAYRTHETDELGMTHVRMTQLYRGVPVVGGELIVHLTEDKVTGINGRFVADLDLPTFPAITSARAADQARAIIVGEGGVNPNASEKTEPVIFVNEEKVGRLALPIQVEYEGPEGIEIDRLFVDAENGQVLGRHPLVWRAKSRKIYHAKNTYALSDDTLIFEEGGSSSDTAAMNAYNFTGTTYDFYRNVFGRDSFNNQGTPLVSLVHYGLRENNSYWIGFAEQMAFGDGDGTRSGNWANALDIVAHEMTHGVTQFTSNLTYAKESGALNEAASDILGECVAFASGQGDWRVGVEIWTPPIANDALRYMFSPTIDGVSADYYPERTNQGACTPMGSNDFCGVHRNSGIANLFFYLLTVGGNHPRNKTSVTVPGIGIEKARAIWYRALTVYMTSSTDFQGARAATARAASDLYSSSCRTGGCGWPLEYVAVHTAWDAVGAPGGTPWNRRVENLNNAGFELGNAYWSAPPGVITASTATPPHGGSWVALLNGRGKVHTDTLAQSVAIPANASSASLTFWLRVGTAETTTTKAYDTLQVQVLNSSGALLATLAGYSNLNRADGYSLQSFDLNRYRGSTIQIRFVGAEDYSLATSFVIDDTALTTLLQPPSP